MKTVIRPAATDDILRQYRYYLLEGAYEAAADFMEAVDHSIASLRSMPEMGVRSPLRRPALSGLRSWPVKGFEDVRVYYLIQDETLRVIRVLHGKRDIQRILKQEF